MNADLEIQLSYKYKQFAGILILIGSFGCLKEAETMDMILGKRKFQNSFPYFQ